MKSQHQRPFAILFSVTLAVTFCGCHHNARSDAKNECDVAKDAAPVETNVTDQGQARISDTVDVPRPIEAAHFRLDSGVPPAPVKGAPNDEPDPMKTIHPALTGFSVTQYRATDAADDTAQRADVIGQPRPVHAAIPNAPPSGTASLREILGPEEWSHVFNSLNGICGNDGNVAFERKDGQTFLTFENGLEIVIDDETGTILEPPGLPVVSDGELADLTWKTMQSTGEIEKWRTSFRQLDENGAIVRRLSEIRLDEVLRVADKAFVAWRLVAVPPSENGSITRLVFWIDIRSKTVVSKQVEFSGANTSIKVNEALDTAFPGTEKPSP